MKENFSNDSTRLMKPGIGKDIRLRRRFFEITQEELGKALGISASSVHRIERGKREVTVNELERLTTYFISVEERACED